MSSHALGDFLFDNGKDARLAVVLGKLHKVRANGRGGFLACCPAHEDSTPSLSIDKGQDGRLLLKCHAGCEVSAILDAMHLSWGDLFIRSDALESPAMPVSSPEKTYSRADIEGWPWTQALYEYQDSIGKPLFLVVRLQVEAKKSFVQYRPVGHNRWAKGLKGLSPVLYRLPELAQARATNTTVFVVEGEKDVETLRTLGLTATCNPGGAGKWRNTFNRAFEGCHVVVLPDNDEPGENHARMVSEALMPVAASVRVVHLPGLAPKGDVTDWLARANPAEFARLLAETPALERPAEKMSLPAPDPQFHLTDFGNARRLVQAHGREMRYCHTWSKWFTWDGRRWQVDQTGEVARKAKDAVSRIYAEASGQGSDKQRHKTINHARNSEAHSRLKAMVAVAASEPGIPILPEELDANPWLFNVSNGTLNLKTGLLGPHDPTDNITRMTQVAYVADAPCPVWEAFLSKVLDNDQQLVRFMQRAVGYALTGDTSEHCLFFLFGAGRNGKSTFLECIYNLLGDYAQKSDFTTFLEKKHDGVRNDLARLKGSRFLSASETAEGRKLAEALVKDVTGGETITARHLYGEFFNFRPSFKLFLSANHKPTIRGTDEGIWSRIRLIPFTVFLEPHERDRNLAAKLAAEMPGILAWAVRGCLEWQRTGLTAPALVTQASNDYRQEMDPLTRFLQERCAVERAAHVSAKILFDAFTAWQADSGERALSQKGFGDRLTQRGFQSGRSRLDGVLARTWSGLRLL